MTTSTGADKKPGGGSASFPEAGPSVCVISNGNHVIYLKITSVHNARFHQTQWVTADMIEWKQKAG